MGEILDIAEALWKGEKDTYSYHPFGPPTGIEKIAMRLGFTKALPIPLYERPTTAWSS